MEETTPASVKGKSGSHRFGRECISGVNFVLLLKRLILMQPPSRA